MFHCAISHDSLYHTQICTKMVYAMDPQINLDGITYHNHCAKCADCNCQITISNFRIGDSIHDASLLCKVHYLTRINKECKNVHVKPRSSSSSNSPQNSESSTPSRSASSTYIMRTLGNNTDLSTQGASHDPRDSPLRLLTSRNPRGRAGSFCSSTMSPMTSDMEHLTKYHQNECSTNIISDINGPPDSTQSYTCSDFASATTSVDSNDFMIASPLPSTGTNTPDFISNVSSPSIPDDNNCLMKDNTIDTLQNTRDFATSVSSVCGTLVTRYRSNQNSPAPMAPKKTLNDISDNPDHEGEGHLSEIINIASPSADVQREYHSALGLEKFYPQMSKIDFQRINNEKGNVRTIVEFHEAIFISPRRLLDSQVKSKRIVVNDFSPDERESTSLLSMERRVRTQEVVFCHRSEDTSPRETILPGLRNRKRIAGYETQKLETRGSVFNRNSLNLSPLYLNKSSPIPLHQSSSSSSSCGTKVGLSCSVSSSPETTPSPPTPSYSSSIQSPTLRISESSSISSTPTYASNFLSSSSLCTLRARTGRSHDDVISASPSAEKLTDGSCTTSAYGQFLATLSDLSVPLEGNLLLGNYERGDTNNMGITEPRAQTAEERHYQWKLRSIMVEKGLARLRSAACLSPDRPKPSNTNSRMSSAAINSTRQNIKEGNGDIIAADMEKLPNVKEEYGPVEIRDDLICDLCDEVSVDAESVFSRSPYEIYLRNKERSLTRLPSYGRESCKDSYSGLTDLAPSNRNNRYHPSHSTKCHNPTDSAGVSIRPFSSSSSTINNNSSSGSGSGLSYQSPLRLDVKNIKETQDTSEKNSTDCEMSSGRSSPDSNSIHSPSLSNPSDSPFKSHRQSLQKTEIDHSYPVQKSSDSASFFSFVFVLSIILILVLNLSHAWQLQWPLQYPDFYSWRDVPSLHHSPWIGVHNATAVINQRLMTIETKFAEILQGNEWKTIQKVPSVSVERMIDDDSHRLYFRIVAHFNATTESITDRLNFPTLDQTQRTVDPFHESSTLLFAPSTSTQIIRKTTKRPIFLSRREMISALITKEQTKQIFLKNFHLEKILKNLQINVKTPMVIPKGIIVNALLDVNFNLSSLPFKKEKKDIPYSYEKTFYTICRRCYSVLSTFGNKTKRKKNTIGKRNRKYDIFPNNKNHDVDKSCSIDDISNNCGQENVFDYQPTVHSDYNEINNNPTDFDNSNDQLIENKENNLTNNKIEIKDHKMKSKIKNETYVRAHQDMIGWFIPLGQKSTLLLSILHVDLGSDIPDWAAEFGIASNIILSTSSFVKLVEGTKV